MTRKSKHSARAARQPGPWALQDAKARFSEVVRRAHDEGPQHVTVHGRAGVVVLSADEFLRLKRDRTGAALVAALRSSAHDNVEIEPHRFPLPVRDVIL